MKLFRLVFIILIPLASCAGTGTGTGANPYRWEEAVSNYEETDAANPPEEGAILFLGSSSITMWKDVNDYFPDHQVLNRGFGGSQFSDLLEYDDRIIYPYKPSKIFIYEGDNDVAAGDSPETILKEAKELRERIARKLPGVPVVFISAKPSVKRWEMRETYKEVNQRLQQYAENTPLTMFADVWTAMLDENGVVYDHIFLEDNLHMNPEGYQIWQSVLAPYMEEGKRN